MPDTPAPILAITGTFLDEVTHDIPAHNWGFLEWEREFAHYAATGIDTVVMIRSGWGKRLAWPSRVVSAAEPTLPVYVDMVEQFLALADTHDLRFFFGLYDSQIHWNRNDWKAEVAINQPYAREAWERFGGHASFAGWYLPHETFDTGKRIIDINTALSETCKQIADLPVLSSPYWNGRRGGAVPAHSRDERMTQWDEVLAAYAGRIDVAAFQDGTAEEEDLAQAWADMAELANRHGLALWANVETFDRDMYIKFPPLEWRKLVHKLTVAAPFVEKAVSFEMPHFLSPHSTWDSARHLYDRYQEYLAGRYPALEG